MIWFTHCSIFRRINNYRNYIFNYTIKHCVEQLLPYVLPKFISIEHPLVALMIQFTQKEQQKELGVIKFFYLL